MLSKLRLRTTAKINTVYIYATFVECLEDPRKYGAKANNRTRETEVVCQEMKIMYWILHRRNE